MTALHPNEDIRVILLDVEGTTTPIDFVYQTLFPYAKNHLRSFLAAHEADVEVQADLVSLRQEYEAELVQSGSANLPPWFLEKDNLNGATGYLEWQMSLDRKTKALKSLQGKIWEAGYRSGALKSVVYADVQPAFERWKAAGKLICIYSSGSVLAQKLLFAHTQAGDLTHWITQYFDTNVGPKQQSASYRTIAHSLQVPPEKILFLSDVTTELAAASFAGCQTLLAIRPGNFIQPDSSTYQTISTF